MTKLTASEPEHVDLPTLPVAGVPRWLRWAETMLAFTAAVMAMVAIWLVFRPIGDLYVALAAGRDIVQGKMGSPDEWSFTAAERVWINQNWGTHLMYYLSYIWGGEWGLLSVKAGLIALLGLGVALACRARRVSWPVSWVVAGAVLLAGKEFIDQRPNLTSLALDPILLWLLYRSRNHPHRIWWAAALLALWANMHGGFFFGIGMMGLWTVCQLLAGAIKRGVGHSIRTNWPLVAATGAAILSAGLLTPFGLFQAAGSETFLRDWNLTHPLIMAGSDVWRQVREWRGVWIKTPMNYGSAWEFCVLLGILGVLGFARLVRVLVARQFVKSKHLYTVALLMIVFSLVVAVTVHAFSTPNFSRKALNSTYGLNVPQSVQDVRALAWSVLGGSFLLAAGSLVVGTLLFARARNSVTYRPARADKLGMWIFDVILSSLVLYMAFASRRFLPLAAIVIAPLMARQLHWLTRLRIPATMREQGVAVGIAVVSLVAIWRGQAPALFMLGGVALAIWWLARSLRARSLRVCPPIVLAVMIGILAFQFAKAKSRYFAPNNPTTPDRSFYDRMVGQYKQPTKLTEFVRENDIAGRVLHEWRWEGYLRWRCPQLKLLLGGRAQQIYSEQDWYTGMSLGAGWDKRNTVPAADPFYTRRELSLLDVHLMAVPEQGWQAIIRGLLNEDDQRSGWTYLYRDGANAPGVGSNILLVDTRDPRKRALVEQALRGELEYPSRAIEAFSQASTMMTPVGFDIARRLADANQIASPSKDRVFRLLIESVRLHPTEVAAIEAYQLVAPLVNAIRTINAESTAEPGHRPGDILLRDYLTILETALDEVRDEPIQAYRGQQVLTARRYLNLMLAEFYGSAGYRGKRNQANNRVETLNEIRRKIIERWVGR